ncbi:unnamed protein product [Leptosia nina]|uniref:Centrosomal protein of 135 kDa n=1 Tax=Leptosia nina TaxID=320188 RepID=A0AAV1J6D8_9NEOP
MTEAYINLKRKLEELGYNNALPVDAVNLVECILADLLQTTRSLQHYMKVSKEALLQRDTLLSELEPYKCDNAKLIQENNQLHHDIIRLKEEHLKILRETQRKIKTLSDEVIKKDSIISKLQHDVRDLSLRGLCAETLSSRNRSKRKDAGDNEASKICVCHDKSNFDKDLTEKLRMIQSLQEQVDSYSDEIHLLKNQVQHRGDEITRLKGLLEGGRPFSAITKEYYGDKPEDKILCFKKQFKELENCNEALKKELDKGLEKQHEAMLRALDLADKNKALKDELHKMDTLALKVEDDCNKRLNEMTNEIMLLQNKIEILTLKNSKLEKSSSDCQSIKKSENYQIYNGDSNNNVLYNEIKDLMQSHINLLEKISSLSQNTKYHQHDNRNSDFSPKCLTKTDLQNMLQDERQKYEKHINSIQEKLNETINLFSNQCKNPKSISPTSDNSFIRDLHVKLCESEQKILLLKKENDDLKRITLLQDEGNKNNYKEIIKHLNLENSELSKENIELSKQINQLKTNGKECNRNNNYIVEQNNKLQKQVDMLTKEINSLRKDSQENTMRYKDILDACDRLKRDLVLKQRQIDQLEEENSSYKVTNRTGKASSERLREECCTLREQIKKLQSDLIKEKTVASQIRNLQLETERSTTESQSELLCTQRKLSNAKDAIETLERKCKDYQAEICVLKSDKSNLIDNIKTMDKERDRLVLELDQKTENVSMLDQKLKSQLYDISKLEGELSDLQRKFNLSKISEHKITDYESQISFLNGEILRLTQQCDTAAIENKHLQNSLADANGSLKITKIELEKSRREVDGLKQQLQHYVAEIRRIEELLSQKEAERSDMLEHFASLSVEANILENTNHSLESESASKSLQLQSYISKIQCLEEKVIDKDKLIDSQAARIATLTCNISSMEQEIRLITEEKSVLEQNVHYLKKMCQGLQVNQKASINDTDSELKLYESRIRNLSNAKEKLELERKELTEKILTTENLLTNARKEIIELKLALQDATTETKSLQERVSTFNRRESDSENAISREELELPLILDSTIHEESNEDDSTHFEHNRYSPLFRHGSTL